MWFQTVIGSIIFYFSMKTLISSQVDVWVVAHKWRLLYTSSLGTRCPEVSTALKDALCTTQHVTQPSLFLHTRNEQQQGFFIKHVASDWSDGDAKANLLLWETDLCTAGSPSVVLETCETGGRIQGSPEELSWRRCAKPNVLHAIVQRYTLYYFLSGSLTSLDHFQSMQYLSWKS